MKTFIEKLCSIQKQNNVQTSVQIGWTVLLISAFGLKFNTHGKKLEILGLIVKVSDKFQLLNLLHW